MAMAKRKWFGKRQEEYRHTEEQQRLLDAFFSTKQELEAARSFFENVTDPDLIDACVYDMNAIQRRYSYILGLLREENVCNLHILR